MPVPVIMPKFGMTQEQATVVRWLRQAGECVDQGDPLLEVETDKTVMEVEAPATGILGGIQTAVGQTVPVTAVIGFILAPGEALSEAAPADGRGGVSPPSAPPRRATPVARRRAAEAGIDIDDVPAAGPARRVTRQDVEDYLAQPAPRAGRPRATPAARRAARERGADLSQVAGSGPRGRIQQADVLAASTPHRPPVDGGTVGGAEVIPLAGMRRTIASRMQASYQTVPHITLTVEADMSAVQALRQELKGLAERAGSPVSSPTAILVKVCAWALRRHRWLNASLQGEEIHLHRAINIGVAVALDEGLIVPVIHNADCLGLAEIAARLDDLASRARQGRLLPDEVAGGTFTLTNLGMYRVRQFTAIINPPQCAVLAVGRIAKRPMVVERADGDEVAVRPMMEMTLSADHRVLDGAVAARFLEDLVRALENPAIALW